MPSWLPIRHAAGVLLAGVELGAGAGGGAAGGAAGGVAGGAGGGAAGGGVGFAGAGVSAGAGDPPCADAASGALPIKIAETAQTKTTRREFANSMHTLQ